MIELFNMRDNYISPLEMAILVSEEYEDKIIKTFKERWTGYGDPSQFLSDIADEILPDAESLLPASIKRIEKEINDYLGVYNV